MNSIIIIGGGKCVVEEKLGSVIDQFDTVVRFVGFENRIDDFTGRKTDIIVINVSDEAFKRVRKGKALYRDKKYIITYPSNIPGLITKLNRLKEFFHRKNVDYEVSDVCDTSWPEYFDNRYIKYCKRNYRIITSGLNIIDRYLRIFDDITIHGFDIPYYGDKLLEFEHYYSDNGHNHLSKFHDLRLESKIINKLVSDNRVKLLSKKV